MPQKIAGIKNTYLVYVRILIPLALLLGLALRLWEAASVFLNPDELIHYCRSQPVSWYEASLTGTTPPLLFFLMHYVQMLSSSELFLRFPFVVSGTLFPWIVYKWLDRLQLPWAALSAFLLLEFSPNLIALSAQIRGYVLALLFVSAAIFFLQRALDLRSFSSLILSSGFLYLGILSEYSVALVTGAMGVYGLLVLLQRPRPISFVLAWACSQLIALALYASLYQSSMGGLINSPLAKSNIAGYLRGAFPKPGENLVLFSLTSTFKQFAYLASSIPMGTVLALLFCFGLRFLWRNHGRGSVPNSRPLAIAILTAFLLALGASLAMLFACLLYTSDAADE